MVTSENNENQPAVRNESSSGVKSIAAAGTIPQNQVSEATGKEVTRSGDMVTQAKITANDTITVVTTLGKKTHISRTPAGTIVFDRNYGYNKKDLKLDEARFQLFMNDLLALVNKNGKAIVDIEGSASKVPTRTYKSNKVLAQLRANAGKEQLLSELKARGFDLSKIEIRKVEGKVQGPSYKYDYKNVDKYAPYQYTKITAR